MDITKANLKVLRVRKKHKFSAYIRIQGKNRKGCTQIKTNILYTRDAPLRSCTNHRERGSDLS